jgi:hypothetical protein
MLQCSFGPYYCKKKKHMLYKTDGLIIISSNNPVSSEELWHLALGAAVPRGDVTSSFLVILIIIIILRSCLIFFFFFFQVTKTGATRSRLAAYESKRKGPKRHDGKAWKAGEAGCPKAPVYEPLTDGAPVIVQGGEKHEFMCLCLFRVIIVTASYMLSHVKLQKLKQGDLRLKRIHFVHPPKVSAII